MPVLFNPKKINGLFYIPSGATKSESAAFSYSQSSYRVDESNPTPTITGDTGGTFTSTPEGLTLNSSTGEITLSSSVVSSYVVTYTLPSGTFENRSLGIEAAAFSSTRSFSFDGLNDTINCGNITALNGLSGGSWSLWLNVNDTSTQGLFNQWGTGTDRLIYSWLNIGNGRMDIYFSPGNKYYRVNNNNVIKALNAGEWFHLAIVFDGTISTTTERLKVYINGEVLTGNPFDHPTTMQSSTSDFIIGTYPSGTYFDGKMDEVSIWNSSLSSAAVTEIYNSGVPNDLESLSNASSSNIVAWYRMGD